MTHSPAPRPDDSTDVPRRQADLVDADRTPAAPPDGAISLADLIADSGPLPPDAALECVQRLAELLARLPIVPLHSLDPVHVLIDDDGGVWLRDAPEARPDADTPASDESVDIPRSATIVGMNRIGRLLLCLASGELHSASGETDLGVSTLPGPLSTVAARLFSRNGSCYSTYADLATDAASMRGVASQTGVKSTARDAQIVEVPAEPRPRAATAGPVTAEHESSSISQDADALPETGDRGSTSNVGLIVLFVLVLAAAALAAIWQWL